MTAQHDTFTTLIQPVFKRLYAIAYRLTGNQHDAEDLLQDLFIKIYPKLEQLNAVENKKAWLTRVLYHLFIDHTRKEKRKPHMVPISAVDTDNTDNNTWIAPQLVAAENTSKAAGTSIDIDNIERALQLLSHDHRTLITLHDIEGHTLDEIQHILAIPIGTAKSRLNRARQKLREILTIPGTNA